MDQNDEVNQEIQETTIPITHDEPPIGIDGWLILVVIGLVIAPIRLITGVFSDMIPALSPSMTLSNYPGLTTLLYMEIIVNLIFAAFSVFLLFFIFTKNKLFPRLMIIFLLSNFVFIVLDLILAYQIPLLQQSGVDSSTMKEFFRSLGGAVIWVPYFIFSKRVKNTFIK